MTQLNRKPIVVRMQHDAVAVDVLLKADRRGSSLPLRESNTGRILAPLSVHLPAAGVQPGEFCVKGWTYGAWLKDLLASGLFIDTGRRILSARGEAHVWKLKRRLAGSNRSRA